MYNHNKFHSILNNLFDYPLCKCSSCIDDVQYLYYLYENIIRKLTSIEDDDDFDISNDSSPVYRQEKENFDKLNLRQNINQKIRILVYKRDDFKCKACNLDGFLNDENMKNLTIDHIIPLCKGGTNTSENMQVLCKSCNSKKGSQSNDKFLNKIKYNIKHIQYIKQTPEDRKYRLKNGRCRIHARIFIKLEKNIFICSHKECDIQSKKDENNEFILLPAYSHLLIGLFNWIKNDKK